MKHSSFNYVRVSRERHGLSREDLAGLMEQRSLRAIRRFERGDAVPTLEGALALQVIFGMEPRDIFPGLFEVVEDAVMRRARDLYAKLEGLTDRWSAAKRELLEAIPARARGSDIQL